VNDLCLCQVVHAGLTGYLKLKYKMKSSFILRDKMESSKTDKMLCHVDYSVALSLRSHVVALQNAVQMAFCTAHFPAEIDIFSCMLITAVFLFGISRSSFSPLQLYYIIYLHCTDVCSFNSMISHVVISLTNE